MRNLPPTETELSKVAERTLRDLLPQRWAVELRPAVPVPDGGLDATLRVAEPNGAEAQIAVQIKNRISPKDALQFADRGAWGKKTDSTMMLVASYLSPHVREDLELLDIAYVDATGNVYVALSRPAVFIKVTGASKNPWPEERSLRSLRGAVSGRVVRALLDFDGPYSLSDLATLAGVPVPTASRVVALLDREAVLTKEERGRSVVIDQVEKPKLLRRWVEDYSALRSNRVTRALAPRGIDSLLQDLRSAPWRYAVSGSLAAAQIAPYAPARLALVYVDDLGTAEGGLDVIPDAGSPNVLLLSPFDEVVFERTWERDGVRYAAPSQVAADLMTGPGRGPEEAEELVRWCEQRGSWQL